MIKSYVQVSLSHENYIFGATQLLKLCFNLMVLAMLQIYRENTRHMIVMRAIMDANFRHMQDGKATGTV